MAYKNKAEVLNRIRGLKSMADLPVGEYAEEEGLADSFIVALRDEKGGRNALKPTQLRRFFHQVKLLARQAERSRDGFDRTSLAQVMPFLAYAVGRELIPQDFYDLMKLSFGQQRCATKADFLNAANFLEAIMAFHKYHSK